MNLRKAIQCSLILLLTITTSIKAQEISTAQDKKGRIEIRGGFLYSCFDAPYDNRVEDSDIKTGFYAGVILEQRMSETFYLQTGVVVADKGGKIDNTTVDAIYFQVPIYFSIKLPLKRSLNTINLNFGPYVAYGIFGNTKYNSSYGSSTTSTFGLDGPLNNIDAGLGLEIQLELNKKFVFTVGSDMGLVRSFKKDWVSGTDAIIGNSAGYLTIGYKI